MSLSFYIFGRVIPCRFLDFIRSGDSGVRSVVAIKGIASRVEPALADDRFSNRIPSRYLSLQERLKMSCFQVGMKYGKDDTFLDVTSGF